MHVLLCYTINSFLQETPNTMVCLVHVRVVTTLSGGKNVIRGLATEKSDGLMWVICRRIVLLKLRLRCHGLLPAVQNVVVVSTVNCHSKFYKDSILVQPSLYTAIDGVRHFADWRNRSVVDFFTKSRCNQILHFPHFQWQLECDTDNFTMCDDEFAQGSMQYTENDQIRLIIDWVLQKIKGSVFLPYSITTTVNVPCSYSELLSVGQHVDWVLLQWSHWSRRRQLDVMAFHSRRQQVPRPTPAHTGLNWLSKRTNVWHASVTAGEMSASSMVTAAAASQLRPVDLRPVLVHCSEQPICRVKSHQLTRTFANL